MIAPLSNTQSLKTLSFCHDIAICPIYPIILTLQGAREVGDMGDNGVYGIRGDVVTKRKCFVERPCFDMEALFCHDFKPQPFKTQSCTGWNIYTFGDFV